MSLLKDNRFKHIVKDPKFRNVPKKERKVTIDKRFEAMFTDDKFKLKYSVDKRGRPVKHSQVEDLKKYYDLSGSESGDESNDEEENQDHDGDDINDEKEKQDHDVDINDEEEEKQDHDVDDINDGANVPDNSELTAKDKSNDKAETEDIDLTNHNSDLLKPNQIERSKITGKVWDRLKDMSVDYARGDGMLETDSSSSDELTSDDSEEEIEHAWGELDKDAEQTDEVTKRLAVCHLDWDRVTATDIMVLLHSFLPQTGFIKSVTIYPSEFGMQRMKDEEIKGPRELTVKKVTSEDEHNSSDEEDYYHKEKLREYQLKRLKYYYAVVEFDSTESANKVYTECDKMEYESSATRLDLRFIPDDMTFDQEPREVCTNLPDAGKYRPRLFANTALQQEKVELTWDETDPDRVDITKRIAAGAPVSEADLKAYIATSSDEEKEECQDDQSSLGEDDVEENKEGKKGDEIIKYRSLLAGLQEEEEKKRKGKVEMEITWDLALENKTKAIGEKQITDSLTPFEKIMKTKKENKKKKTKKGPDRDNLLSDDDVPSDIDMNDPFFKDEFEDHPKKNKKSKNSKKKSTWEVEDGGDDEESKRKAELELLLADDDKEETNKRHFSLKGIQEKESNKKKKGKKSKVQTNIEEDNFKIDLKDDRFNALFTSHHYNLDPADSHFRKTKAMDDIISEKSKRRRKDSEQNDISVSKKHKSEDPQLSSEVSKLLNSVKNKSKLNIK